MSKIPAEHEETTWLHKSGSVMSTLITALSNLTENQKNNATLTITSGNFTRLRFRRTGTNDYSYFFVGGSSITSGLLTAGNSKLYRRVYDPTGTTITTTEETLSAWELDYPA